MRVKKLRSDAIAPQRMSAGAAGLDLYAVEGCEIAPGEWALVKTGIAVEIPVGFVGDVRPRSGWSVKHGITVLNSPGTIDSDYRGEVGVPLINHGREKFVVKPGERVAQLVMVVVSYVAVEVVDELSETRRGDGGFGSTGR